MNLVYDNKYKHLNSSLVTHCVDISTYIITNSILTDITTFLSTIIKDLVINVLALLNAYIQIYKQA